MPPPRRISPVSRARSAFFDEPQEREFFVPVGQGRTSFGTYISPQLAARNRLEMDEIELKRDEDETKKAENFIRRLESGSRSRLLPYTERAQIAQQNLAKERAESDLRLRPLMEAEDRESTQLRTSQAQLDREDLPAEDKLADAERTAKLDMLETADPYLNRLAKLTDNPRHHLAYESYLRGTDPALPRADRQRSAMNKALRLAQDQDAIEAIEQAELDGTLEGVREDFITDETDDEGVYLGPRLVDKVDRGKVARLLSAHKNRKLALQQAKEERIANKDFDFLRLKVLDAKHTALKERLGLDPKNPDLIKELESVQEQMEGVALRPTARPDRGTSKAAVTPSAAPVAVDQESLDSILNRVKAPEKK